MSKFDLGSFENRAPVVDFSCSKASLSHFVLQRKRHQLGILQLFPF